LLPRTLPLCFPVFLPLNPLQKRAHFLYGFANFNQTPHPGSALFRPFRLSTPLRRMSLLSSVRLSTQRFQCDLGLCWSLPLEVYVPENLDSGVSILASPSALPSRSGPYTYPPTFFLVPSLWRALACSPRCYFSSPGDSLYDLPFPFLVSCSITRFRLFPTTSGPIPSEVKSFACPNVRNFIPGWGGFSFFSVEPSVRIHRKAVVCLFLRMPSNRRRGRHCLS